MPKERPSAPSRSATKDSSGPSRPATEGSGLQIIQDEAFQETQWKVQRISWCVVALLLLAALFGAFGKGPLSHARAGNQSLEVEYERFAHALAPTTLKVTVLGSTGGDVAQVRIAISRQYLDAVSIERISPQPVRVGADADNLVYEFAAATSKGLQVTFEGTPEHLGIPTGSIGLAGVSTSTVRFRQLIYP